MSNALSVAKELVRLSLSGDETDPLTNLRLQKLLYYAQSWSLVIRKSELFPEGVEAWRHGPVIPKVYRALPDGLKANQIALEMLHNVPDLAAEESQFVTRVWESYKQHSALQLSRMTHEEGPWQKAWGGKPLDAYGCDPIRSTELENFFNKQTIPGPLAEYEHNLRKEEDEATRFLAELPELDVSRLLALSKSRTPAAEVQLAAG